MADETVGRVRGDPPLARSITAAARRINLADPGSIKATIPRKPEQWTEEAWTYYRVVPEVKFAVNFFGNCLGRLRLYPGVIMDPDEPPVPVMDAAELTTTDAEGNTIPHPDRLPMEVANAAEDEWARVDNSMYGRTGIMRQFGVNLTVTGDSYIIVEDDEDTGLEEWSVYSESNVKSRGTTVSLITEPGGKRGRVLPEDTLVYRVWRQDAQWPSRADSNLSSVLDVCMELLIYSRQFRAVGKSRNNAGLLLLPNELDFAGSGETVDDEGQPIPNGMTRFEWKIVQSLVTPVEDEASASSVVPHIIRGPKDALEQVRHVPLDRKIDDKAIERVEHLIRRLAHGIDGPPELITGMADANHWTAWQIDESTYTRHVEPVAQIPAHGLSVAFLRPALLERGGIVAEWASRIVLGVDPTGLVQRPDRGKDADAGYERGELSGAAWRRYRGFSDIDAPNDEERLRRYALERGIGAEGLTRDALRATGFDQIPEAAQAAADVAAAEAEATGETGDATAEDERTPATEEDARDGEAEGDDAVTGAGAALLAAALAPLDGLGDRLAGIDARLRERVQAEASASLAGVLRRAGNRLRGSVQGTDAAELVNGVAPERVGPTLVEAGRQLSAAEVDTALEGAFDELHDRWNTWSEDAYAETAAQLARATVELDTAGADDDRNEGWLLLLAALRTLAANRVQGLTPEDVGEGEYDPLTPVAAGIVRAAITRAGGQAALGAPSVTGALMEFGSAGGIGTGPRAMRSMRAGGLAVVAFRWETGAPRQPFPPHQLSGVTFTSWSDDRLASPGWPSFSHVFPGDHHGCQCSATPIITTMENLAGV